MNQYKPIYYYEYNPQTSFLGKKTDHASYHVMFCELEYCNALEKNKCCLKNSKGYCPYGKKQRFEGPTPKAKTFYDFFKKGREKYGKYSATEIGFVDYLTFLCKIGEYIFLPLSYLDNYVNPIVKDLCIQNEHFLPLENYTLENIIKLIEYHPYALMGGEIKAYQEKEVPEFIRQLKFFDKEMYLKVMEAKPTLQAIVTKIDYRGRKAYLNSLLPGKVGITHDKIGYWDGKVLKAKARDIIPFSELDNENELTININDKTVVWIVDNDTVDEEIIKIALEKE